MPIDKEFLYYLFVFQSQSFVMTLQAAEHKLFCHLQNFISETLSCWQMLSLQSRTQSHTEFKLNGGSVQALGRCWTDRDPVLLLDHSSDLCQITVCSKIRGVFFSMLKISSRSRLCNETIKLVSI